ncbi:MULTISPECIES: DUF6313 family protein [unclassified Streptomyces]|uniref:DUF6313 family protein n=1 Tax=Streptomyces sp. Ag109_G2-15 TaxID=1938850 RepID=UPI000BDD7822|nr:hypothetical protein SAMN06272765_1133 [Streptomyces sp. Ag109_G2-15]
MRSLYDLHAEGGDEAKFAEQFTHQWHAGDWHAAEDHWEQLVVRMLRAKGLEMYSAESAMRQAEMYIRNFAETALPVPGSRCPLCGTSS